MTYGYSEMSGRTIETYPVVRLHVERKGNCPVCGKRTTRRVTLENTVSPFNKAADGHVRNRTEIKAKLQEEADAWTPDFHHATCLDRVTTGEGS